MKGNIRGFGAEILFWCLGIMKTCVARMLFIAVCTGWKMLRSWLGWHCLAQIKEHFVWMGISNRHLSKSLAFFKVCFLFLQYIMELLCSSFPSET